MATKNVFFVCDVCGKPYENAIGAKICEDRHGMCPCKKQKYNRVGSSIIGYGKTLVAGIRYDAKEIVVYINDDGSETYFSKLDIKYCPLCGERL